VAGLANRPIELVDAAASGAGVGPQSVPEGVTSGAVAAPDPALEWAAEGFTAAEKLAPWHLRHSRWIIAGAMVVVGAAFAVTGYVAWRKFGASPLDEIRIAAPVKNDANFAPPAEPPAREDRKPARVASPASANPPPEVRPSENVAPAPTRPAISGRGVTHTRRDDSATAQNAVLQIPSRRTKQSRESEPAPAACADAVAALGLCPAPGKPSP